MTTRAYPFDQGVRDKLGHIVGRQGGLFDGVDDSTNLGEEEWRRLLAWLARQRLVFHNAKFDLMMLRAGTRHWAGAELVDAYCWDTMVVQKVLDPLHSVGLKETGTRLLDPNAKVLADQLKEAIARLPKNVRRPAAYSSYDLVEWAEMEEYAAYDAELTIRLKRLQDERISEGEANIREVDEEIELCEALYRMESWGLRYDVAGSEWCVQEIDRRIEKIRAELPFDPTNIAAAKRYFFTPDGIDWVWFGTTDSGKPKLDDEVQRKMVEQKVPHAAEYSAVRDLSVARSMWYQGYIDSCGQDGRLRTNYRQTKVRSGRMSVERVQLQAIPKDDKALEGIPPVRSLITAADGYQLWNLDLSQAELRVATHYARCSRMAEMLEAGADLHGITTREIFGVHPGMTGSVEHDYKTCSCEDCEDFNVKRDIAKRLTFGGIFQIGWKTFQATLRRLAGIEMPDGQAQDVVRRWRSLYPEFGYAYRRAEHTVRDRGWVNQMGGRYRSYFGERDFPNTAWNRIVQGSLAKFNNLWIIKTTRELDPEDGRLVLSVHDSQVLELRDHVAQEVAERVADDAGKLATELFGTPMLCDVKTWGKVAVKRNEAMST